MNHLYRSLVAIVEQGTIVQAAESLHLSQPTLTRHLQQLEENLGVPLFHRVGKRLTINHTGQLIYAYAKRMIAIEDKMYADAQAFQDPEKGVIHLGAGLTPAIYLLPQHVAAYRSAHPGVQFHVRTASSREICEAVQMREVDLGIVTTLSGESTLFETHPLYEDDLLLVSAPDALWAKVPEVSADELALRPFCFMHAKSGLHIHIKEVFERAGLAVTSAVETDSLESISRMVQHGVGVAVLPRSAVQDDLQAGRLAVVRVRGLEFGSRTIRLICLKETALPASAQQFATYLSSLFPAE